jgi:hypothetical protein
MLIYVTILESGIEDKFEDTKRVIRICKSKKVDHTIAKGKRAKEQTTIYKTYT